MANTKHIADIKKRLGEMLDESGVSMRAASKKAGLGSGYVQDLLTTETDPTITKLAAICEANKISLPYVLLGLNMTDETRRLLTLMEQNPQKIESVLVLLGE